MLPPFLRWCSSHIICNGMCDAISRNASIVAWDPWIEIKIESQNGIQGAECIFFSNLLCEEKKSRTASILCTHSPSSFKGKVRNTEGKTKFLFTNVSFDGPLWHLTFKWVAFLGSPQFPKVSAAASFSSSSPPHPGHKMHGITYWWITHPIVEPISELPHLDKVQTYKRIWI